LKNLLKDSDKNDVEIPAGIHKFNFDYKLPDDIPGNVSGYYGAIKYEIEARLDLPWKFDLSAKKALTIVRIEDLNLLPELKNPLEHEILKSFGCFSCNTGPLLFKVKIPKRGYALGENLNLIIEYSNYSDNTIKCTRVALIKCEKYTCIHTQTGRVGGVLSDFHIPGESKLFRSKVMETEAEGCSKKSECNVKHIFQIPSNIPVSNQNCSKILQISYELKVTAESNPCVREAIIFPITVGHVAIVEK
jgi:hypothetical protein